MNLNIFAEKGIRKFCLKTWSLWEMIGVHVSPNHFYWPIPDTKDLLNYDFDSTFSLEGIDWSEELMLKLLEKLSKYSSEYSSFYTPSHYESSGDGSILYGMLREYKPKQIIEIGGGASTKVSSLAIARNELEDSPGKLISIEPYPSNSLLQLVGRHDNIDLLQEKVEDIGDFVLANLRSGDVLFIDSSHVIKCGNDVHYIYLKLLPRVPVGTIIHIHDIRFPYEYPKEWLVKAKKFWNEQYLLQMFLTFNDNFRVLFAGNYMYNQHPDLMESSVLGLSREDNGWPGCFWIERVK